MRVKKKLKFLNFLLFFCTGLFFCFSGNDVVIVKNGRRICGTGAALANAPIAQNKAYFEIKIQCTGL